ncbi:P-loop containing nucleoside triphosphate hydrolase protein [Dipodascopsis uninucleata]
MSSIDAVVTIAPLRSSLANLPPSLTSLLGNSYVPVQNVIVEITKKKRGADDERSYVGWTGFSSSKHELRSGGSSYIEIDPVFAKSIGLDEGQEVILRLHVNPPEAHVIHLEPLTTTDWENIELHAQVLENSMLSQIRAVSLSQKVVVYVAGSIISSLKVTKIEPDFKEDFAFAKLSPNAEVIVAPKVKKQQSSNSTQKKQGRAPSLKKVSTDKSTSSIMLRAIPMPHPYFERDQCLSKENSTANKLIAIYANNEDIHTIVKHSVAASVSLVKPTFVQSGSGHGNSQPSAIGQNTQQDDQTFAVARKVVATVFQVDTMPIGSVALSYRLSTTLGLEGTLGNIVWIEAAPKPLSKVPRCIFVHPFTEPGQIDKKTVKVGGNSLSPYSDIIGEILIDSGLFTSPITNMMRLPCISNTIMRYGGIIEFEHADGWVSNISDTNVKLEVKHEIPYVEKPSWLRKLELSDDQKLLGVDDLLAKATQSLKRGTGVLVTGSSGSGKSALLKWLQNQLSSELVYNFTVSCSDFTEERLPVIKETLQKIFSEAAWYAPSVVMFEGIDKLIPEEVEHIDSSKTRQLSEIFVKLVNNTSKYRKLTIVATASSNASSHKLITSNHLFGDMIHLKAPDKNRRRDLLENFITQHVGLDQPQLDLLEISARTEGFVPSDIKTLVQRAVHESLIRALESGEQPSSLSGKNVIQEDFERVLKDFTPSSLRGVNLQKSTVSWNDIGGLKETKRVLLETLEWPTKYAPIFEKCPLRLRSGLLLYGYPGCGKTFLASAVAHECGLNFISIKGPEILNKYIGASEKSIRELFERAQAARPCILFFDEFDSIAPKRGHDSTGVTDRVVNQMLTQMDGAEGLEGVYVLAATSRPDLIDSALLRPGRLDKSLLCDMPSFHDRADIISILAKKMHLSDDVDVNKIAEETSGYSSADLQALLYNAHLEAIHDLMNTETSLSSQSKIDIVENQFSKNSSIECFELQIPKPKNECDSSKARTPAREEDIISKIESQMRRASPNDVRATEAELSADSKMYTNIIIEVAHINRSLATTKPSISVNERQRLSKIYYEFTSGRSGEMPNGMASNDIGGRATLM